MMYNHGQAVRGSHQTSSQNSMTPGPTADPVLINHPIHFTSGQFAGETVHYELIEIQKASLGRKYARVDRRPLDPPPVVLVHIWRYSPETGKDEEVNYEEVQTHGLLCTVDLFPVPAKTVKDSPPSSAASVTRTPKTVPTNDGFVHFNPSSLSPTPSLSPSPSYRPRSYGPSDIVHYYEGTHPLLEQSKTTQALVGATFVQPVLVELFGKKCIVFVFSDLAVKSEGTFTLRYRVFDLFSPNVEPHRPSKASPGPCPNTPSSLSVSSTPSPTSASGYSPSPPSYPDPSSLTSVCQSQHQHPPMQSHFQSHPSQHSPQISMNPYPDPSQDYTAPPPISQPPRRRLQEFEESLDYQAIFAPHEAQTRIEPSERDVTLSILAECWAKGSFRIYSTKEFPGLPASTDLTKQLARWGVRLNIRETERRRRRRSMMDQPEEEARSDGETDDAVEGTGLMREPPRPPRKATKIKPKLPQAHILPHQADYRSSTSTSPTQPPQQRRITPPSPNLAHWSGRNQPRQDSDPDDEYEDEPSRRRDVGQGTETLDYDESLSNYSHLSDRLRHSSRSFIYSGVPAYQNLMPSSASASLNPTLSISPANTQPHLSTGPTSQVHYDYGTLIQPQGSNASFVNSGVRSSFNGVDRFGDSQNAPAGSAAVVFSRYSSSARKRDSDGSSTTSRRSAGSVGSVGEFQRITPSSFNGYGVGHGMDGSR